MTPCSSSRHTRPVPAASLVEVRGKRVPVCAACIQALASNGVQGVIHPLPDPPEPTMPDTTPPVDPDLRAKRSEAARKGRRTRERNALARAGEVVATVVEQPAPAVTLEDGDGVGHSPATGDGRTVLVKRNDSAYAWPSGRLAVGESLLIRGAWRAWSDSPCEMLPRHFSTPALAAAHLGAVLPGEDARVVLSPVSDDPGRFVWPSGQIALTRTAGDSCLAWRRGERVGKTYDHVTDALIALGARLPDAPGDGEVGAPRVGRSEPPAWRDPFPPGGPTPRERELQTQVEAQAAELADINAILDTTGSAPGQATPERVRALADYAVETGESVLRAHEALDAAGIPTGGQPADRIRILAERRADPLTPQIRGIVAQILAGMEDRTSGTDGLGIAYDIRALRLAVGIES